jgi:two-component system cell cycle sensor histidine kinase/response regulator CckA
MRRGLVEVPGLDGLLPAGDDHTTALPGIEFRALVERLPDHIKRYDRDLRLLYANPAALRAMDDPAGAGLGKRPTALDPLSPAALQWEAMLREVFATGQARSLDWERPARDGGAIWLHVDLVPEPGPDGTLESVLVIGHDIDALKRAQREIRHLDVHARALIEKATDMVVILAADRTVRYVSPSVQRILGYMPEACIGRDALEAVHPDDQATVEQVFAVIARTPGEALSLTYRYRHAGGDWRILEATATNLLAEPEVEAIVFNSRDVTEHAETEQQLRQAQKMDAIGRLAGGVAHDFNNLLTVIRGNAELLLGDMSDTDPRRPDADEILLAAERAAGLTRQLLAFSRRQVVQPKVVDLNAVVRNVSKMLQRLIGEDVELVLDLGGDVGFILADPGQLEQVLLNLCVNARDAMPKGGRLTISSAGGAPITTEWPVHEPGPPQRHARLVVSDKGTGMSATVLDHLFEPFFTTKERGTGLGLATVYGIVKQAGGDIGVASEPGVGTTITIRLPSVEPPAEPQDSASDAPAVARGTETVLVVDDEAPLRRTARRVLEGGGYRVLEADSGASALVLVAALEEPLHLLLTDVVMPGMSGTELATRLCETHPALRVLYMSGYTDDTISHYGAFAPGVLLVEKPFTIADMMGKVREALDAHA